MKTFLEYLIESAYSGETSKDGEPSHSHPFELDETGNGYAFSTNEIAHGHSINNFIVSKEQNHMHTIDVKKGE